MPFLHDDLYLTSGTGQLTNSWVNTVYKFDSSSFYNWEEDNEPLYDLEERTDQLHEMAGSPASEQESIMLVVSDTGIDNKKVFGSLSSVVEALPNTIRQPVIIEVCASGNLGSLHLENIQISPSGGGLEIINRGFAKVLCGSATPSSIPILYNKTDDIGQGATLGSSTRYFQSLDTSETIAGTQVVGLSGQGLAAGFWDQFYRSFAEFPEFGEYNSTLDGRTISFDLGVGNSAGAPDLQNVANSFYCTQDKTGVEEYSDNSVSSDHVGRYPLLPSLAQIRYATNTLSPFGTPGLPTAANTTKNRVTGGIYANTLEKCVVRNCSGRIYIRGFCADGAAESEVLTSTGQQITKAGFDIENSDVVIENGFSIRNTHAGIRAVNSNVILNRGFTALRNYKLLSQGASHLDTKDPDVDSAGMLAINSVVTLSASTEEAKGLPIDSRYSFSQNIIGIDLVNSLLTTPTGYTYGKNMSGEDVSESYGSQTLAIQACNSVKYGVRAKNSVINYGGYFAAFQNPVGIRLEDSTLKTSELSVDYNSIRGVDAYKSLVNYNKDAKLVSNSSSERPGSLSPQTRFAGNGQHLALGGSECKPTEVPNMGDFYQRLMFDTQTNVDYLFDSEGTLLPSVLLRDGSYLNAVNSINIPGGTYARPCKGAAYFVDGNSTLDLNGTYEYVTGIQGPAVSNTQRKTAGVYVNNGSTVNIAGPTSITQFGVDVLAENNSNINIGPHTKSGLIDVSGYGLLDSSANHTKVQLHSNRSCLVATKGSSINMKNVGDYHAHWDDKYTEEGGEDIDSPTSDNVVNGYQNEIFPAVSGGFIQFFPNPSVDTNLHNITPQASYPSLGKGIAQTSKDWGDFYMSGLSDFSSASLGGMCVRVLEGSKVEAHNVHFPTGWENPSGPFYDLSGTQCDFLKIWNIADNSYLKASYLSVSGAHPQDVSSVYYGPSAMWTSSNDTGLSGAPSSTPNTSGASILDSFGLGVETGGSLGYVGQQVQKNIGPFRIFVSTHPKSKLLGYPVNADGDRFMPAEPGEPFLSMGYNFIPVGISTGAPAQLFAQGYNPSGDLSCVNSFGNNYANPSDIYPELGFSGYIETLPTDQQVQNDASSFYYASSMTPEDSKQRIWLDESAMNTFANAKNGTLNTSGRRALFSVYRALTDYLGESFYGGADSNARGIGSINLFDLERDL